MADTKLFRISDNVQELPTTSVALEKDLQTLIENNMDTFLGVTFLKSEYKITEGRIDSIGIDENNCPVIIEYKRHISENVINQGLFYLHWLLDHQADFKLLVIDTLGLEKAQQIDWSMPCVICIANDFTKYDVHAVNQIGKNIRLIRYKKFGPDLILLEQINAPHVSPIKDTVRETASQPHKDKTFDEQLAIASPDIKQIYENLHTHIMSLGDDITENKLKLYTAYKKMKNIICVQIQAKRILLYLRLAPHHVPLEDGFCRNVTGIGHWGSGNVEVTIKKEADFIKAKHMILQAYQEN